MADNETLLTFEFPSGNKVEIRRPSESLNVAPRYAKVMDTPPRSPGFARMGWTYTKAVAKWKIAGSPVRSQQRIDELLVICKACPMYADKGSKSHCKVCGCALNAAPNGLINKIAMATESCPLTPPKWTAEDSI